ncbi:hypothetical protein [Nonomuraea rubra]|uniref:hypothetical protein n=1 Tax=Nonomuraea rubra TaxID=46180 RepID=UPI0033EED445
MPTALLLSALACTTSSACHSESIDLRPMPSSLPDPAAFRSYICDHGDVGIPAHAVELMTGLPDRTNTDAPLTPAAVPA